MERLELFLKRSLYESNKMDPLSAPHKMVKHTQTIRRLLPTNCLSVLNHFVELAMKGLNANNFHVCLSIRNVAC